MAEIIHLLKLLCVHGVWDLGLYSRGVNGRDSLPVYCPFDKRFFEFWEVHKMDGIFMNDKQNCCNCNRKREWGRHDLEQHIGTKVSWYHRALGSLLHELYDDCDVNEFLYRDGDILDGKLEHKVPTVSHLVKR